MKRFYIFLLICIGLFAGINVSTQAQSVIYYVSKSESWNYDIYSYNINTGVETRLTTNASIDNHPSISHYDTNQIVFSSNRGAGNQNEFNIFIADVNDIDGTAKQLTDFSNPGVPGQLHYPNRHPHWHPNGRQIIYTSQNLAFPIPEDSIISECSHPVPLIIINGIRYRMYERMNVIKIDDNGTVIDFQEINVFPDQYVGHPSFNHTGDKIVFTASTDNQGKNWEVFSVGYDPITMTLIPGTLQQCTSGPNVTSNPIKLSGGASFSADDSKIIFNSTRTTGGNSQLYSIPSNAVNVSVDNATRLTFNHGNDYVPEPLSNGDIVISSDLGPSPVCDCGDTIQGATDDLDVVLLHFNNNTLIWRQIIGTDNLNQTLLIADNVSWFCGTKMLLAVCSYILRTMNTWNLWLIKNAQELIPDGILFGYGSGFNAKQLYHEEWTNLTDYMGINAPNELSRIIQNTTDLGNGFPGWSSPQIESWMMQKDSLGNVKYVVPGYMKYYGIGDPCYFLGVNDPKANDLTGKSFDLIQNYPNPFSEFTTITYVLKEKDFVELKVYDILGKEVATLVQEEKPQGKHSLTFHANNLPGGIYYNSMRLKNTSEIRKMVLLK